MSGRLLEISQFSGIFPWMVSLAGASGSGKSYLADELSIRLLDYGVDVVQVNAGDFLRQAAADAGFGADVGGYMTGKSETSLMQVDRFVDGKTRKLIDRVAKLGEISKVDPTIAMPTILLLTSRIGSAFTRMKRVNSVNVGVYCPPEIRAQRALDKKLKKTDEHIGLIERTKRVKAEKQSLKNRDHMDLRRLKKVYPTWLYTWDNLDGILANDVVIDSSRWSIENEVQVVWALLQPWIGKINHHN